MSIPGVLTEKLVVGGESLGGAATIAGGLNVGINEPIPTPSTDLQITFPLDVSATKVFYAICDQAVTIETNNGTTPDDTIVLAADVPYVWRVGKPDAFILAADVTSIFVTNASGVAATLKIQAIVDPTP